MSQIGYYRYKTTTEDGKQIALYKNGNLFARAYIHALPYCTGDRLLKYLDSTGQYRFYTFNKFYEVNDRPKAIGTTNKFITSILTGQTNSQSIGYKNDRQLSLTTEATAEQLALLADLPLSPRVYLYIGTHPNDTAADWLEVTVTASNPVKRRKAVTGRFDVTVTLPEWFTIRKI